MFALLMLALACAPKPAGAPGAAADPSAAGRLDLGAAQPGVCVSAVPGAGKAPPEVDAARAALTAGQPVALPEGIDHPAAAALRGALALQRGELEPARAAFRDLANAWPTDPCLGQAAAWTSLRAGRPEYAGPYLTAAVQANPTDPDVGVLAALHALTVSGDPEQALRPLRIVHGAHPEHALTRAWMGKLLAERGEHDVAMPHLQAALAAGFPVEADYARAAQAAGDMGAWLRVAGGAPPLAIDVRSSPDPMAALAAWMGAGPGPLPATLHTSMGPLRCALFWEQAPLTVGAFVKHARGGGEWLDPRTGQITQEPLYKDLVFHRVIPEFMIQGGDPVGDGTGGPGYEFADEIVPTLRFDQPGRLAMANSGPATNGSQFFVTEVPVPHLDGKHTIFGQCDAEAVELVKKMARVPKGPGDKPLMPIVLTHVQIGADPGPPPVSGG